MSLHLAPNTPWLLLGLVAVAMLALGVWAYRFAIPPLPAAARRLLPLLRGIGLALLVLLLAQPVLERLLGGGSNLLVLMDRSLSMQLPVAPGGGSRAAAAERAVAELAKTWRGRGRIITVPFAERVAADSLQTGNPALTAIGDALAGLSDAPQAEAIGGVVLVSDGANNAGRDPVAAALALGLPVHTLRAGATGVRDRAITDIESPAGAQAGRRVPVRVHVVTQEPRGVPLVVVLNEGTRELARTTVIAPGPGAEAVAELHATPLKPGLALWSARVDSTQGELTTRNNTREVAFPVAPGRLRVVLVTTALNWDFTFFRRSLVADSSLELRSYVREPSGWRHPDGTRGGAPGAAELGGVAVVVLDGVSSAEVGAAFDAALVRVMEQGGGVLVMGGASPGVARLRGSRFGALLGVQVNAIVPARAVNPAPAAEARDLLMWDDDPARGERAWREAAPLADVMPLSTGGGDRVLVAGSNGSPLFVARRGGRGQALLVNGSGTWRWSLADGDDLTAERARRLWRGLVHWLAEPVQAEPLRVRPERWLTAGGEVVRLLATLQDDQFRPVAQAEVNANITGADGRTQRAHFVAGQAGSYTATLDRMAPGRYRVEATASKATRSLGRSTTEFAVDRWSLEEARALPDSATLAAISQATGGHAGSADEAASWAHGLRTQKAVRGRTTALRLWESPWIFGLIVGLFSIEWIWRRRRGLP